MDLENRRTGDLCLEVLWRRPSRSPVRRASRSIGTKFVDHFFSLQFRWFFTPPTKMSYNNPYFYPKYEILWDDDFFAKCPFKRLTYSIYLVIRTAFDELIFSEISVPIDVNFPEDLPCPLFWAPAGPFPKPLKHVVDALHYLLGTSASVFAQIDALHLFHLVECNTPTIVLII